MNNLKDLIDSVSPFDTSQLSQETIDKINSIGCTSFLCKFKRLDDGEICIIPLGDKDVKFVIENDGEWENDV